MHQRQARFEGGVAQIREELAQLLGGEHALVDDGARRQRREVDAVDGVLHPLAQHEGAPLERHGVDVGAGRRNEQLLNERHGALGDQAQVAGVGRDGAPTQHRQPLLGGRVRHDGTGFRRVVGVGGQEDDADGVTAGVGQREPGRLGGAGEEAVRDLHQDAGAVSGVDLGAGGATVGQALQDGEAAIDDVVVRTAVEIGHHADTAGVVLVCRVVEASGHRRPSE